MYLRYISLSMYNSGYVREFESTFFYHSRFISNYLSTQVRKLKIETDETFNMLSIRPSLNIVAPKVVAEKALSITVPINIPEYLSMDDIGKYEYYLFLLDQGYEIASHFKKIPVKQLLQLHQNFREGGYRNEWQHKRKVLKTFGIDILLNCYFTSTNFRLELVVVDRKTKENVVSGIVLETLPDEIFFNKEFKDIILLHDSVIITDFLDRPKFKFLLTDIFAEKFNCINIM